MFKQERNDRLIFETLCGVEGRATVCGNHIEVDACFSQQLHSVERQCLTFGAFRVGPCSSAPTHAENSHHCRRNILSMLMGFTGYVVRMVDEQRIGATRD